MPADEPAFAGTLAEFITTQFYAWERPCRGWQVYPYPVEIEPPFEPFWYYAPPSNGRDDGRHDTWASSLVGRLLGERPTASADSEPEQIQLPSAPAPEPSSDTGERVEFVLAPPQEWRSSKDVAERLFASLEHCEYPVSFEIVGTADAVRVQFSAHAGDAALVRAQLRAHCPDVAFDERESQLETLFEDHHSGTTVAVEFGLSEEFMRPLRPVRGFDPDPLVTVVGALDELGENEHGILQVLFQAVRHPWTESILRAVTGSDGKSIFDDAPDLHKLADQKTAARLYAAVIRVGAAAPSSERAWEIARHIGALFAQFGQPASNRFIPLTNDRYPDDAHWADVVSRRSRRTGMILNLEELVSLVHVPSASVRSAKLHRTTKKTKAPPAAAIRGGILLGENVHHGNTIGVRIGAAERMRHTYVIGASGTGKSSLLLNMMVQDIEAGEGIGLLDPHGDLADELLARIPEARLKDVVLFDPSDEEQPVAWNILQAHTPLEKTLLSSDLVATFKRLSTSWGDQMTSVLGNAVLAMLESTRGGSVGDLRRFLVDADWRNAFLKSVTDPEIVFYWHKEFPLLAGRPQASILTRLDTFLRPRPVRAMVTARTDRLDFRAVLDERRIFIAKLAQGAIGEENSSLLGSLLVSKFHQVALSRQDTDLTKRAHFYLYVDEFHHFVTPTLASLLSGARKYRLGLTLAHQDLRQLASRDADVAAAVIANPCTRICFRVGEADARMLKESFSFFDGKDLQNLGVGEAVVRVERSDWDFNLRTMRVTPVAENVADERRAAALAESRSRYGVLPDAAAVAAAEESLSNQVEPATVPVGRPSRGRPPAAPRAAADAEASPTPAAPLAGRGGEQHKYLQNLIRRWAEDRGYRVTIEKPVLDGLGTVDVVIEKAGRAPIACEISVTTSPEHELANAQKCLAAGFENVFLVAPDRETLARVRERASKILNARQMKTVRFVLPEQVFSSVSVLEAGPAIPERPTPGAGEEVLTAKEVEELLRLDVKTIYRYVQRGTMPYVRIQSNLRFIRSDVLAWFARHRSDASTKVK